VALETPALLEGTLLWRHAPARWLNRPFLRLLEPRLRRKFRIYPDEVQESRERLHYFLKELQNRIGSTGFLVGDSMTLADIAAVSLLDPLEIVPEFVRDETYDRLFAWKRALAAAHARRQRSPWLSGDPPPGYPSLETILARLAPRAGPCVGRRRYPLLLGTPRPGQPTWRPPRGGPYIGSPSHPARSPSGRRRRW
jgi:hypothetical protein